MDVKPTIRNREFFPAKTPEARTLALEDPYAFLIACCLERRTKSENMGVVRVV